MKIRVKKLHPDAKTPTRATPHSSGLDLAACLMAPLMTLPPGERVTIGTGIAIELPRPSGLPNEVTLAYEAQVRPRSGLTAAGVITCGGIGTVDNDYRGEIRVTLINLSDNEVVIRDGQRIAQLVVAPLAYPDVEEVNELSETERGSGGFGSTGL